MENIPELRTICQPGTQKNPLHLLSDGPSRFLSIHVTRCLLQKNISSTQASLASLAAGIAACLLLLSGSFILTFLGALVIALGSLLRFAAGEIEIYRKFHGKTSGFGLTAIYFDTLLQYMMHLLVPLCLSYGVFQRTHESLWLLAGMGTALSQVFLLVMHHAQESALLRKINHERGMHALRAPETTAGKSSGMSSVQKLIGILNQAMLYPALGNLLLIFSLCALVSAQPGCLKAFLILTGALSAALAFYTIVRKLKNNDPDKQFAQLFSQA